MGIDRIIRKIDFWQQKHGFISFPYAVIKKYGDDNGGYHSALLTYYGFLSLFPLLLVTTTLIQLLFHGNTEVKHEVAVAVGHFFPLLGSQLESNIHGMKSVGIGLTIGLLFTLYGARGAADALRFGLDSIWQVPKKERAGFPKNVLHSFIIMLYAGAGFIATLAVSSFTATLGHATWVKVVLNLTGFLVTFGVILGIFSIAILRKVTVKFMMVGAAIAAAAIQLLLTFGGLILAHQLQNLGDLYGTFAIVLGLLFWIYLIAQIVLYAAEIDTVRYYKLWPRSINDKQRTDADRHAYKLYLKTEERAEKNDDTHVTL
jgi:YihY family inner membrane protein